MVTVKMLKPYYIKSDADQVRVVLAYQYFSIIINEQVYHFVPIEAREIKIDRKTKKVVNVEDTFSFQKGKDIIYISMTELISLPDFLIQLYFILESYDAKDKMEDKSKNASSAYIIRELERLNVMRSIDKALDEKNDKAFYSLVKYL